MAKDLLRHFKDHAIEQTAKLVLKNGWQEKQTNQLENESKTKRITELESRDQEIEKLKARFEAVENLLDKSLKI